MGGRDKMVLRSTMQHFNVSDRNRMRLHHIMCLLPRLSKKKIANNILQRQVQVHIVTNPFIKFEKSYCHHCSSFHDNCRILGNSKNVLWGQITGSIPSCRHTRQTTISNTSSSPPTQIILPIPSQNLFTGRGQGSPSSSLSTFCSIRHFSTNGKQPPVGRKKSKFSSWFPLFLSSVVGVILYNFYSMAHKYSNLLPPDADLLPLPKSNGYIYIYDSLAEAGAWQSQLFPWLPQIQIDPSYTLAKRLVQDAKSDDVETARKAVTFLAQITLEESQYHQIAQMVDYRTSVGLANSYADPRMVGVPRYLSRDQNINLSDRFREILNSLPKNSIHQCVVDWSSSALKQYSPTEQELEALKMESLTGFESEQIHPKFPRKPKESQFLVPCLQAILSHSRDNTALLLQLKTMEVIMAVVEKYRFNRDIMYIVVKIIANLTCDPNISEYIKETGCVRLLAEFSESADIKLSMPARRALHNLDREFNTPILPPGLYQLYPDFRFDEDQLDIDIVFVHGLLGGAFRTWRREDQKPVFRVGTKPADQCKPSRIQAWFQGFTPATKGIENPDDLNSISKEKESCSKKTVDKRKRKEKPKPIARVWKDGEWHFFEDSNFFEQYDRQSEFYPHSQCWPRDFLPKDVKSARILAVDFDSFVTHWTNVCPVENIGRTLFDRSSELLGKLTSAGIGSRPIIWVTHSMGGLLVKHLLLAADESKDGVTRSVADQTGAIMFCSVPHVGSNIAALNAAGTLLLLPTQEVKELRYGSEELKKLNANFRRLRSERKYKVISFGETKNTVSSIGVKLQLVPLISADPGYGDFYPLETDHLNICKVRSRGAFVYQKLVDLVEIVRNNFTNFDDGEAPIPDSSSGEDEKTPKK